ncbi:hypothetical protein GLOTRDRAFT_138865 [Gloeophyllum trabeum ATCC 11539]|uniref:Bromo domain-containing protein n=1 Tax=Gloeophyllum trabeum (strain ATCC 11539 / FP-39264 / Madison 617) TaxID=670483 RepID=S7RQS5_GLOTA|nr:uncharacterized protein GLOTRDRAFT_138865 [Gloeophyllum trabeum ATCC 11539]EPQ55264.1 hypothetical protein GLOTRDRAFT_138865 [Gloeophyllum trabeum ATCC 11539]
MNNLLRTLTESNVKSSLPEPELKLLLATVKESRRNINDPKASDPFYDALEDLLHDLRTVTVDNRDAEPFLKPVSKAEAPDYYEVIPNPMDLQTMLKKVKQKQYKSKKEFKDDLDLIWSNCFTYNAAENHPLRQCATRLKAKAERLLKNITDRKERIDPPIPSTLDIRVAPHPKPNGIIVNSVVRPRSPISPPQAAAPKKPPPKSVTVPARVTSADVPFSDSPAFERTPEGMALFKHLDEQLEHGDTAYVVEKLREVVMGVPAAVNQAPEQWAVDGQVGDKRKLNGLVDGRPRKRTRLQSYVPSEQDQDALDLWWMAVQSPHFMANGYPELVRASSGDLDSWSRPIKQDPDGQPPIAKKKSKKKSKKGAGEPAASDKTNSTLHLLNDNIRTIKRVRRAHAKLAALNSTMQQNQGGNEEGGASIAPEPPDLSAVAADIDDTVDERPWKPIAAGLELGEELADDCLHWAGKKILEHAGFQGTSKAALDVLAGVTSEYFMNVGRTLRFLCDRYSGSMTAEEIMLHTLFESGTTKIQDLERYIKDDVIRYGSRLGELEKKLVTAYTDAADEPLDDDALFAHEDDENEDSAFVMGNFADALGDDFLGLKELGIADELGLSSLSVPKRLLKGKNKAGPISSAAAKPAEPPPPFPPPPPFLPLDASNVDEQIGLLKPYYQQRLSALATTTAGPSTLGLAPPQPALPDDAPAPARTKIGPIGQVMKPNVANAAKKKPKPPPPPPSGTASVPPTPAPSSANGRPLAPATPVPSEPVMPPPPPVKKNPVGRPRKKKLPEGTAPDAISPNPPLA